jgi:hypothetical protein
VQRLDFHSANRSDLQGAWELVLQLDWHESSGPVFATLSSSSLRDPVTGAVARIQDALGALPALGDVQVQLDDSVDEPHVFLSVLLVFRDGTGDLPLMRANVTESSGLDGAHVTARELQAGSRSAEVQKVAIRSGAPLYSGTWKLVVHSSKEPHMTTTTPTHLDLSFETQELPFNATSAQVIQIKSDVAPS